MRTLELVGLEADARLELAVDVLGRASRGGDLAEQIPEDRDEEHRHAVVHVEGLGVRPRALAIQPVVDAEPEHPHRRGDQQHALGRARAARDVEQDLELVGADADQHEQHRVGDTEDLRDPRCPEQEGGHEGVDERRPLEPFPPQTGEAQREHHHRDDHPDERRDDQHLPVEGRDRDVDGQHEHAVQRPAECRQAEIAVGAVPAQHGPGDQHQQARGARDARRDAHRGDLAEDVRFETVDQGIGRADVELGQARPGCPDTPGCGSAARSGPACSRASGHPVQLRPIPVPRHRLREPSRRADRDAVHERSTRHAESRHVDHRELHAIGGHLELDPVPGIATDMRPRSAPIVGQRLRLPGRVVRGRGIAAGEEEARLTQRRGHSGVVCPRRGVREEQQPRRRRCSRAARFAAIAAAGSRAVAVGWPHTPPRLATIPRASCRCS